MTRRLAVAVVSLELRPCFYAARKTCQRPTSTVSPHVTRSNTGISLSLIETNEFPFQRALT